MPANFAPKLPESHRYVPSDTRGEELNGVNPINRLAELLPWNWERSAAKLAL